MYRNDHLRQMKGKNRPTDSKPHRPGIGNVRSYSYSASRFIGPQEVRRCVTMMRLLTGLLLKLPPQSLVDYEALHKVFQTIGKRFATSRNGYTKIGAGLARHGHSSSKPLRPISDY